MAKRQAKGSGTEVVEPTSGGNEAIATQEPFTVRIKLEGTADMLFHRWNCEAVEEKARAAKGSAAKKTDNIESYVWRDDDGVVCVPGEYLRQAIIMAAKFRQDPRSPRKSAMDLFKAAIVTETALAPIIAAGKKQRAKTWDYEDKRRVVVQRSGVNRTRPAFKRGWRAEFDLLVLTPEYIDEQILRDVVQKAGRLVGLADFRPTYGRFDIVSWEKLG